MCFPWHLRLIMSRLQVSLRSSGDVSSFEAVHEYCFKTAYSVLGGTPAAEEQKTGKRAAFNWLSSSS